MSCPCTTSILAASLAACGAVHIDADEVRSLVLVATDALRLAFRHPVIVADGYPVTIRVGEVDGADGVCAWTQGSAEVVLDGDGYTLPGPLLMHELGHAMGLPHVEDRNNVMNPNPAPVGLYDAARQLAALCREHGCREQLKVSIQ